VETPDRFIPRPMTVGRAQQLADHRAMVAEHTNEHGHVNLSRWRERTLFSFNDCPHTVCTFIEVENAHGIWGMSICINCGKQVEGPECPHTSNSWDEAGSLLTCDNCGMDVT
jgi:DNA-directed RNA polymerase subunit RPC12/RpoP